MQQAIEHRAHGGDIAEQEKPLTSERAMGLEPTTSSLGSMTLAHFTLSSPLTRTEGTYAEFTLRSRLSADSRGNGSQRAPRK